MSGAAATGYTIETLLQDTVNKGGSDLHLVHGCPPCQRIAGNIVAMSHPAVDTRAIFTLVQPFLNASHGKIFEAEGRLNVAFGINGLGRFRLNLCKTQGAVAASIRAVPNKIYPLSSLGLPPICATLTTKTKGIIFVTGATGTGKSTTMAAMLAHINHTGRRGKVVTVEDPIETLFQPDRCIFIQREVGVDTPSFELAIQDAMRQDPDILCVGEMRSADAMKGAITAAETGHLVITTLHTMDAAKTAQRIVSAVQPEEQETMRDQLCNALEAVISQELLPRADGKGQVLAAEILLATPAVRRLIRENKLEAIYDILQTGSNLGMISKDASVKALYQQKIITRETALGSMRNPDLLGA
ncbi:MAG: PilT/PilU family type 4a pilus ATPase [Elusimicrobia bacterium]|nr:PilT/PilU family type 4a pilus ATPase [Elusimicrobiota bacterium]